MSRRTIALIIAVVLAVAATVVLVSVVQNARDEAIGEGEAVPVFVAKEAIPAGTTADNAISRGLIQSATRPRVSVPIGAIGSLEEIKGKVASVNILQGEPIVTQRFVTPAEARLSTGLLNIPRNRVAMTVDVALVPGVAGFIQPADRVSILAQLTVPRTTGANAQTEPRVQFVLQNIEVLTVGRRIVANQQGQQTQQQPTDKVILTLAVTPSQAERLGFATLQGQLYFTLLPPGARSTNTNGRTARNAFPR